MATSRHRVDRDRIVATRLCTHKEDVAQINSLHLRRLTGERGLSCSDSHLNVQIDESMP